MAEAKAQLQNRPRSDPWGQPAVLIERDGLKRWVPWGNDTIMSPELLDPLFDDMGLPAGPGREATKKYLGKRIEEDIELCGATEFTMSEFNSMAFAFYEGFHTAKDVEAVYC
jgi:hypothetical protein